MTQFNLHSHLEFTFLDFGIGIPATLKEEFKRDLTQNSGRRDQLSTDFNLASEDSQILEYAFLMDTSRNPLDSTIDHYELVPRGLYFLADMVRRYKGLLLVRSGHGKVIYDFSEKIHIDKNGKHYSAELRPVYNLADAVRHVKGTSFPLFPGTLFTIILPEKSVPAAELYQNVLPPVRTHQSILSSYVYSLSDKHFRFDIYPKELFKPSSFEYISILFLYNSIIETLRKQQIEIEVKDIYNRLFFVLNEAIDAHQGKSCIIFFDFAGLRAGNPSLIKLLYFLLNNPKINELTKAIIVNLPADEGKMIQEIKENLSGGDHSIKREKKHSIHDPLLFRPIPCINFAIMATSEKDLIQWIGLKDREDEKILTSLLLGYDDSYSLDAVNISGNTEGNMFIKHDGRILSTYSGFSQMKKVFFDVQRASITKFLGDYVENGIDDATGVPKFVYLASNGGYQFQYLSLYELLHDKYVASYFAKCLLDKYCYEINNSLEKVKKDYPDEVAWIAERDNKLAAYKFTKIIAVTVSSQLIGISIRNLIENDDAYSFLRIYKENGLDRAPELIMLSNYYSFAMEKPFEKIGREDKVLIVNDVISTGRLVKEILNQVDKVKRIAFTGVFSIVDSRIPDSEREKANEMPSTFFPDDEKLFFTLCSFDDRVHDERIVLRKYEAPYQGDAFRKRINPLLNTVVELKAIHSEQQKILIPDLGKMIEENTIHNDYFQIGHFQQNLSHNAYITNMRSLFSKEDGVHLIKELKEKIEKLRLTTGVSNSNIVIQLTDLLDRTESISKDLTLTQHKSSLQQVAERLAILKEDIQQDTFTKEVLSRFKPDFIFYPHFSGIEKVSHSSLNAIFGTHPDHIIGLQRFDTPKGWRFPFPAKRYNELTHNMDVLILDSGSLTGDSLVQLVDNIAFLDVRSITVLTIITRVDDFHREFYSRLKSIKVKRLKKSLKQIEDDQSDHIIPLEILFGICFHIPVFTSSISCPFCEELNWYKAVLDASYPNPTHEVKKYIAKRQEELKCLHSSKDILQNISYLPLRRQDENVDTRSIFYARDLLGKIDSYRFFPDYFEWFEALEKRMRHDPNWMSHEDIRKELEDILICILHEPQLYNVVNNMLHGLLFYLEKYVEYVLFDIPDFDAHLYYKWTLYPLVRVGLTLLPASLYSIRSFEHILSYNDTITNLYLHYYCWNILYHPEKYKEESVQIDNMLKTFGDNMQKNKNLPTLIYSPPNDEFFRLAANRYEIARLQNYPYLDRPFNNLSLYVYKGVSLGRHFLLKQLLNDLLESIESTAPVIRNIQQKMRSVVDEFDLYLKPSLNKITSDMYLKEKAEIIYRYLSEEPTGILYYIKKIEELHHLIKTSSQEELPLLKHTLKEISACTDHMINKILVEDEEIDCFYKISKQYPCDLNVVLDEIRCRCLQLSLDHSIIHGNYIGAVLIHHHKWFFSQMLNQLVDNARRVYKENINFHREKLHLNLRYEVTPGEGVVTLYYSQNFPFVPTRKQGGLEKLIRHYTIEFAGDYSDNRDKPHSDFEITFKFKLYKYEDKITQENLDHIGKDGRTE